MPDGWVKVFSATFNDNFNYIVTVTVSFIGGGNLEYPQKTIDMRQVTDRLYHRLY
jgi:hypothetical protein